MKFDFHFLFSSKYTNWASLGLILFFCFSILFEFASLIFPQEINQSKPSKARVIPIIAKQNAFEDILHSSLFGVYVPSNLSRIKKSMLNVTLVGILFANQINESQVIIRSANGEERTYNLGDTLPGDVTIKRIMPDGILVERQGTLESLSLPKNELIYEPIAKPLKEDE